MLGPNSRRFKQIDHLKSNVDQRAVRDRFTMLKPSEFDQVLEEINEKVTVQNNKRRLAARKSGKR